MLASLDGKLNRVLIPGVVIASFAPNPRGGGSLLWLWYWRYELSTPAHFDGLLRRLTIVVELPMAAWDFVWRIQNRVVEEWVGHVVRSRVFVRQCAMCARSLAG